MENDSKLKNFEIKNKQMVNLLFEMKMIVFGIFRISSRHSDQSKCLISLDGESLQDLRALKILS